MIWSRVAHYKEMSAIGARKIYEKIADRTVKGKPVNIGLATGNTMLGLYELLADLLNENRIPLQHLHTWNLDEYVGDDGKAVPYSHPLSYRKYMHENFFSRLHEGLGFSTAAHAHFPDPVDPGVFDARLAGAGGLDLQLLGIGFNGHIAFNEPVSSDEITTEEFAALPSRVIGLAAQTIETNCRLTAAGKDIVPRRAVTMGMKQILSARQHLLLACFAEQREPIAQIKKGGITAELPASFLLGVPEAEIIYCGDVISLADGNT
jgi:glucosamine-6-phosphate deaminase